MGLFKGQFYNTTPANHVFVCNHPALLYAGLASFNMNLIEQFVDDYKVLNNLYAGYRRFGVGFSADITDAETFLLNIITSLNLKDSVGDDASLEDVFVYQTFDTSANQVREKKIFTSYIFNNLT